MPPTTITIDLPGGVSVTATPEAWLGALIVSLPAELRATVCAKAEEAMGQPHVPLVGGGTAVQVAQGPGKP